TGPDSNVDVPLPATVEDITAEWLTAALGSRHRGAVVEAVEIASVVPGTATKVWVEAEYSDRHRADWLPNRFVVKGGFTDNEYSAASAWLYVNEARFYRDVAPHIASTKPLCYFAQADESAQRGVIVLEDLSTRDTVFARAPSPFSADDAAEAL